MKVGILTFIRADNYGALLQAYALQRVLENRGHNVELIDYQDRKILKLYKIFNINKTGIKGTVKSAIKGILNIIQGGIQKKEKCEQFRQKYCIMSPKVFDVNDIDKQGYDAVIVGSDQVWNVKSTEKNDIYFLPLGNKRTTTIAYAASCGNAEIIATNAKYFKEKLDNIDYISVREESARQALDEISDVPISVVLDPTLLAKPKIWQSIVKKTSYDNYIFVYRMTYSPLIDEAAVYLARKYKCKVISVSNYAKPEFKRYVKSVKNIGPIELINYIAGAKYVVTDSFHGTAFSLIFNKQFISVSHDTLGARTQNLLEALGLSNRILNDFEFLDKIVNSKIDYERVNSLVEMMRKTSEEFLTRAKL